MPTHRRPPFVIDTELGVPNTPSPFDGYMEHMNSLYPSQIINLPDGLSTMHILNPNHWIGANPPGRPPTPEWAKGSTCTPERRHHPPRGHPGYQGPNPTAGDRPRGHSQPTYVYPGYDSDLPAWALPQFRPANQGPVVPPVVPGPGFSPPALPFNASPYFPFGLPASSTNPATIPTASPAVSPFIPSPLSPGTSSNGSNDRARPAGRHVQIRDPPVSQEWARPVTSSSSSAPTAPNRPSTPSTSQAQTTTNTSPRPAPQTATVTSPRAVPLPASNPPSVASGSSVTVDAISPRLIPLPTSESNASTASSTTRSRTRASRATAEESDQRDRERSMLQKPRRSVSDLRLERPSRSSTDRPPRKRAVCIGINYLGQREKELRGCVNDANTIRKFLIRTAEYESQNIIVLTDDCSSSRSGDSRSQPTYNNIHRALRWLVESPQKGDSFFLFFSGHGERIPDESGDEVDGYDKAMVPLDFRTEGYITDDDLHHILVRNLPKGCRLTAFFDACHSGTMLDLPYIYSSSGDLKGTLTTRRAFYSKCSPSDTVSWSSCRDRQTSIDTYKNGRPGGAMTHAWVTALTENPRQTYRELLANLKRILRPRFIQKPLLSASHVIDTDKIFEY